VRVKNIEISALPVKTIEKLGVLMKRLGEKNKEKRSNPPDIPPMQGSFSIISLGCPKNLVDSEQICAQLADSGLRFTPRVEGADLVVINTCGFLASAREESLRAIYEVLELKRRGSVGKVVVTGCFAEYEGEKLLEKCPGVDRVVGVWGESEIGTIASELLDSCSGCQTRVHVPLKGESSAKCSSGVSSFPSRMRLTAPHVAYLKIAEGCDRFCTFCTIPKIRGKYTSRPLEELVAEARALAAAGTRELILVAQDTSYYGVDLVGKPLLPELLRRLEEVEGLEWIRLLYLYPTHVTDELIDTIASSVRVIPYLDLPLQHSEDRILRRMNRHTTRAEIESLLSRLRERIPGLVIRTTLMTGFPGETEEEFHRLCEFVRLQRFEHLGVFAYSPEPDTPSVRLDGEVPEAERKRRAEILLGIQQEITFAWNEDQVGKTLEVLIDLPVRGEKGVFVGRTYAHAPEIDGVVYVTGKGIRPGQMVPCEIVARHGYDLIAAPVGKPR
jgi:ribosomal protein S12 methylthiotransferase